MFFFEVFQWEFKVLSFLSISKGISSFLIVNSMFFEGEFTLFQGELEVFEGELDALFLGQLA